MDKIKSIAQLSSILTLNAEATSSTDTEFNASCSICKCTNGKFANISKCDELKSIKDHMVEHSNVIKQITYACLKCLYKLYAVIEHGRIKEYKNSRNQRLSAVGELIVATGGKLPSLSSQSETSSSSNSSIIPGEEIFEREFVGGKNVRMDSEYLNDSADDENEEVYKVTKNNDGGLQGLSIEDQQNNKTNSDHSADLDIMFECSESALVTESGGNPDQYKPQPQRCVYCSKTFVRQKMYNRHLRTHENKLRCRSRSASKSRGRTTLNFVVYKCDSCPTTFTSSQLLKRHSKIHLKQHSCNYCHLYFFTSSERDIHQAECFGKEMAKASITRPSTRSVTRSLYAPSQYALSNKVENPRNETKSNCRSKSPKSSKVNKKKATTISVDYDDEDIDYEASVSCSDRFSLVQSWVNKTCRLLSSEMVDEPPLVLSQKEYDIVMLERLIEQSERYDYTCTSIGCDYTTRSLREMSFHDVKTHKSKTYYTCRKCKGRFTSKLFLDYHLYMQNYGEYHCHKCKNTFIYEYKLQHHLLQHQQHESFPCLYCDSSYMSETELRIHAMETGHNTEKRKSTISIDRSMTVENKTKSEQIPKKRVYQCEQKILVLPKTETKRPMQIIWPKYTQIFLGDLDFEFEPGRNCVRTN